jgi:predicted CXXCH cytochrome family protein
MNSQPRALTCAVCLAVLWAGLAAERPFGPGPAGAALEGTAHDLSASGGGACSFCHTPHGALPGTPLWNHKLSSATYQIYQSSSLEARVGQPTGASKLCLSCHDGTVALAETLTGPGGGAYIAPGAANLGTDLSDDHPISFAYSSGLSAQDAQIRDPFDLPEALKLDRSGELQCTTCHDAHDNRYGKFLTMSNDHSQMCVSCHNMTGWTVSSHASAGVPVMGATDPYLQSGKFATVAEAACQACHRPHGAGGAERLLHFAKAEDNCLSCHNGLVAGTNIGADLLKLSRHNVSRYNNIHDPRESPTTAPMHVECADCHNPHALRHAPAPAPMISGALQGVSGVTLTGGVTPQAQFEYEVCFKCHADNPQRPVSGITRQITQTNTRLEFDPAGPSFHPVAAPGVNPNVPSLDVSMNVTTQIRCTDCHSSDSSTTAKGPHGSIYPHLLAARYETSDFTPESSSSYELCYRCHSRNSILGDESFPKHQEHLEEEIPCSACHDPHGISASQGSVLNNRHLINFDVAIVQPDSITGRLAFEDLGVYHGRCFLSCHGHSHSPEEY